MAKKPLKNRSGATGAASKEEPLPSKQKQASSLKPQSEELDRQRVRVAAYFLAEKRGFAPGGEMDDWLMAEEKMHEQSP